MSKCTNDYKHTLTTFHFHTRYHPCLSELPQGPISKEDTLCILDMCFDISPVSTRQLSAYTKKIWEYISTTPSPFSCFEFKKIEEGDEIQLIHYYRVGDELLNAPRISPCIPRPE